MKPVKVTFVKNNLAFQVIIIMLLLIVDAYITYWTTSYSARVIYYLCIIMLIYYSDNLSFWLAFVFIMISYPFGLFKFDGSWMFRLTPTVGVDYYIFFVGILFYKYLKTSKTPHNYFKKFYPVYGIYILILLFIGLNFGQTPASIFTYYLKLPFLSLFLIIPSLLVNENDIHSFCRIIFIFSIINALYSIVDIMYGGLYPTLKSEDVLTVNNIDMSGLSRYTGGMFLSFYSLIMSLYYIINRNSNYKQNYLYIVVIISVFYIFNSATRGWIIATIFVLFGFNFFQFGKSLKTFLFIVVLIIPISFIIPSSTMNNLSKAYERLLTVEAVGEGDISADETLDRLTERGPRVINKFKESPIFGFGYSKTTFNYFDGHVGNHSLLLNGGIIGFIIVYITFFSIIFWLFQVNKQLVKKFDHKGLTIFIIGFLAILIIHSSSRQMYGFNMEIDSVFLISTFFAVINTEINKYSCIPLKKNPPDK